MVFVIVPTGDTFCRLVRVFINKFGAPFTGRISAIIPFLPFSDNEQAVIAYTFMRDLKNKVRKDIDCEAADFACHLHLNFVNDGQIGQYLANGYYLVDLGARSLRNAVQDQIAHGLAQEFNKGDKRIKEATNENTELDRYDVRIIDVMDTFKELKVTKAGTTAMQLHGKALVANAEAN